MTKSPRTTWRAPVRDALNCEMLCLTRGKDGAAVYLAGGVVHSHPGFEVDAVDTVGAGDSFLATLLDRLLDGAEADVALGARVPRGGLRRHATGRHPEARPGGNRTPRVQVNIRDRVKMLARGPRKKTGRRERDGYVDASGTIDHREIIS